MPEKKTIARISVVTDDSTGMYHCGEVDGGFDREMLMQHIKTYGIDELTNKLAYMSFQVMELHRELNSALSSQECKTAQT